MPQPSSLTRMRLPAAVLDRDVDRRRAGVERVLDQLLDDRRRTLDDLAGGDLVGDGARQDGDARGAEATDTRAKLAGARPQRSAVNCVAICAPSRASSDMSDARLDPAVAAVVEHDAAPRALSARHAHDFADDRRRAALAAELGIGAAATPSWRMHAEVAAGEPLGETRTRRSRSCRRRRASVATSRVRRSARPSRARYAATPQAPQPEQRGEIEQPRRRDRRDVAGRRPRQRCTSSTRSRTSGRAARGAARAARPRRCAPCRRQPTPPCRVRPRVRRARLGAHRRDERLARRDEVVALVRRDACVERPSRDAAS